MLSRIKSSHLLIAVFLLAFINGLIYVFLIPPWQHYDEPNHFEYAWLIANRAGLPKVGDFDQTMRRQVARSMIKNDFFKGMDNKPDLTSDKPIWIGEYTQLGDPPFYYLIASLPLRVIHNMDVTRQLYAARLVSLGLYLLSILATWMMMREITSPGNPLRLLVPLTLALLPSYTDLMTSVNSDVAAVALTSIALWGCIRLVHRGISLWTMLGTVLAVGLALFTKSTAFITLPLLGLAMVLAVLRGKWRPVAWTLMFVGIVLMGVMALSWDDAADWYRSTSQSEPTRLLNQKAVLGNYVYQLTIQSPVTPPWFVQLFQPIPQVAWRGRPTKTFTFGGWMWANKSVQTQVSTPVVHNGPNSYSKTVQLSETPTFFAFNLTLSEEEFGRLWVTIDPRQSIKDQSLVIFYDGLVLVDGERPVIDPPRFNDLNGESGVWGGQLFQNLLRNASAEQRGLRFRPWADNIGSRVLPDDTRPSLLLTSILDLPGSGWFFRMSAENIFRSFIGKFGWGHVPLVGQHPYRLPTIIILIGFIGAFVQIVRSVGMKKTAVPFDILLVLLLLLLGSWGSAITRSIGYICLAKLYLPVARYAMTGIVPTILILVSGWYFILRNIGRGIHIPAWSKFSIYIIILIGFDVYSIISILKYYQG